MAAEGMDPEGPAGSPVPRPCSVLPFRVLGMLPPRVDRGLSEAFPDSLCAAALPSCLRPSVLPCSVHVFLCNDNFTVPFHSLFFQRQGS